MQSKAKQKRDRSQPRDELPLIYVTRSIPTCAYCGSRDVKGQKTERRLGELQRTYRCNVCDKRFKLIFEDVETIDFIF